MRLTADADPQLVRAADIQEKFEFYVLGLTFGVLAVSVQTASSGTQLGARIAELLGWLLLLVSGIVGLWRIEWRSREHQLAALDSQTADWAHRLRVASARGSSAVQVTSEARDYPIEELIKQTKENRVAVQNRLKEIGVRAGQKYRIQRWTFILGLLSLMISRGWGPLLSVVREIRG